MHIPSEINKMKELLDSFLGSSKNDLSDNFQLQYPCPRCIENKGSKETSKYNLEVNLRKGVFQCWSCAAHDDEMHGSIVKLIRLYGNEDIANKYKLILNDLRESRLFRLSFDENDFEIDFSTNEENEVKLPRNYKKLVEKKYYTSQERKALSYLAHRGIGWDIITKYKIGYTEYDATLKLESSRVLLPSYDKYGELNYWTARDITSLEHRQKYCNPNAERKELIFNEEMIDWDADIVLVEGPFDHIVVPNSIPLLGKVLKRDFKIYQDIITKANARIFIWLDGDAYEDVKKTYKLLNHNNLYGKIRYIPTRSDLDPSEIYAKYGRKGIIQHLKGAKEIDEIELNF